MAVSKEKLEEKVEELAELLDSTAKYVDDVLKHNGVDLSEIKKKGQVALKRAIPVIKEKRNQLELFLLNRQLSSVNQKIEKELEKKEEGSDGPASED